MAAYMQDVQTLTFIALFNHLPDAHLCSLVIIFHLGVKFADSVNDVGEEGEEFSSAPAEKKLQ